MDLSIIVPTFNEKKNIKNLIFKILREYKQNKINGEIIVVDDNSPDGTSKEVEKIKKHVKNLKLIKRAGKSGLSSAVIEGWKISKGKVLGVMDADLSHPVDKIHELHNAIIKENYDMSIGSRYVRGGKIEGWGAGRLFASKGSTLLAKVFTSVNDPMSGYFMINRNKLKINELNSKGFKILLEVLIKTESKKIKEVPITFVNRTEGESKASIKELFFYIQNLLEYASVKYKKTFEFMKFCIVGFIGTLINLATLFLLTDVGKVYYLYSASIAFVVAMTSNYFLNKTWTFNEKIQEKFSKKYFSFAVVSIIALIVNLSFLYEFTEKLGFHYIVSQVLAIIISLAINYIGNKTWTFRN